MPRPALFTYEGALRVLGEYERPWLDKLDVFLGVGVLVGGAVEPGVLSLVDPKNEATASLRKILDGITAKLTGLTGVNRQDLVAAAHTVIAVTSVFDAFREVIGPDFDRLAVTDDEKFRVLGTEPGTAREATALPALTAITVPAPSATRGFRENLDGPLSRFFTTAVDLVTGFLDGLSAWADLSAGRPGLRRDAVAKSRDRYAHHFLGLAATVPEFRMWTTLGEQAATRAAIERTGTELTKALAEVRTESLERFERLLSLAAPDAAPPARSYRAKIRKAASAVLGKPLLRGSTDTSSLDAAFPTVERGFVAPAYRLAVQDQDAQLASEQWWAANTDVREDIDTFLAAHLSGPDSTTLPLLVLGHPGAGKSLLMDVLAARLPASRFTVVPVQLRKVRAEDPVHRQIETALSELLSEQVGWGAVADEARDGTRVVLLDGFDELIQASGVQQSTYIEQIREFQVREADLDRPVAVVITSRTLVVDRARIPHGVPVVKLEEFDDARVDRWLEAWHAANTATPGFRLLTRDQLLHHGDLARQPLLLLMLVIYAADPANAPLDDENLSKAELYERLIDSFVQRQARDKSPVLPSDEQVRMRAAQARWRLSIAALAMFNRGRQYVMDVELNQDLAVFAPGEAANLGTTFATPISDADRTVENFFFIHSAKVNEGASTGHRTYEFLHATFGEYLIAEVTLTLLGQLVAQQEFLAANPYQRPAPPDDTLLYALVSHQALLKRKPILDFAQELFDRLDAGVRAAILDLLGRLLRSVDDRVRNDKHLAYSPGKATLVSRTAAYSANLVCLRVLLDGDPTPIEELVGPVEALGTWRSLVHLWQAGFDSEGWGAVRKALRTRKRDDSWDVTRRTSSIGVPEALERAQLLGDGVLEGASRASTFMVSHRTSTDEDEQHFLNEVLFLMASGTGRHASLFPYQRNAYREALRLLDTGVRLPDVTLRGFVAVLSRDAWQIPSTFVTRVVEHVFANRNDRLTPYYHVLTPLTTALCAHPHLLDDALVDRLATWADEVPRAALPSLLSVWQTHRATGGEHFGLTTLMGRLDDTVHRNLVSIDTAFAPDSTVDYILESPCGEWPLDRNLLRFLELMWNDTGRAVNARQVLALAGKFSSAPDDTGPEDSHIVKLVEDYLKANQIDTKGYSLTESLEELRRMG